jgi:hypothetical protein
MREQVGKDEQISAQREVKNQIKLVQVLEVKTPGSKVSRRTTTASSKN